MGARAALATTGPLALAHHGIQWGDRPVLPREAVESVEPSNQSPVTLRVMARVKAWPYGQGGTAKIPNLLAALEVAETLGYPVRGGGRALLNHAANGGTRAPIDRPYRRAGLAARSAVIAAWSVVASASSSTAWLTRPSTSPRAVTNTSAGRVRAA